MFRQGIDVRSTHINRAPGRPEQAWRRRFRPVAAAVVVMLVAACQTGGSGAAARTLPPAHSAGPAGAVPSASASQPVVAASPSPAAAIDPRTDGLDVTFDEFAITLEAAVIRPGPVTLIIHNAGQLTHGFEMEIEGSGKGGDRKEIETRTFRSGETLRVEANLPAGIYEIECFVGNHSTKGMRASLAVRANAPLIVVAPGTAVPGAARIVQFAFVAASLDVQAGSRVTWTNDDPAPHTVTADDGTFDSKQLDPGTSFSVVIDRPGTFAYHCEIHPTMVGTVVVH